MINGFLPNLIHSIDGSIMRLISQEMIEKGYIINHLHDSIQTHPNYLDDVYESISKIYKSNVFKNFLDINVFTPMRNSLLKKEKIEEFDRLVMIFKKECEEIHIDNFSAKDMYPYE